jgi:hypothetical protein
MKKTLWLTLATIAIAAMVAAGISTSGGVQVAVAQGPPAGTPYGQVVSEEAQTGEGGFGADIKTCREIQCAGFEQADGNNGIGDARASDEAGKSPGKLGPGPQTRDEFAGNPNN